MQNINKEVTYGSALHSKIIEAITVRNNYSEKEMAEVWRRAQVADDMANMYFAKTAKEDKRVANNVASQQYTPIYVPYSFALMLTAHTYEANALVAREPVFQYTGRHGETQQQIQLVEAVQDYQVRTGRMLPHLFGWLYDKNKYGLGIIGCQWEENYEYISEYKEVPVTFAGVPLLGRTKRVKVRTKHRGYVGNTLSSIRPYDWRPDPSIPLNRFQFGEFCGHVSQLSWTDFMQGVSEGRYTNAEAGERLFSTAKGKHLQSAGHTVLQPADSGIEAAVNDKMNRVGTAAVYVFTIVLIPKHWGLGDSLAPEKWIFEVLDKLVVIGCRPAGNLHNNYPYATIHSEMDMHQFASRGMLEIGQPLNDVMTWLVNTHFFAVRRALNDLFVVDPMLVNTRDVQEGGQGGIIRKKPAGYGKAIRDMFYQVPVNTVTNQHLSDTRFIAQYMQLLLGVNENSAGVMNAGGRRTATEIRTAGGSSAGRMQIMTEFDSCTGFDELSSMMLKNWMQYYEGDQLFRIAGSLVQEAGSLRVDKDTIVGSYDFVPIDGAQPIDRFAMANLWKEFMKDVHALGLSNQYDIARIAQYIMSLSGAKNTAQFKIVPDAQIQQGLNNGNLSAIPNGTGSPGSPVGSPVPATTGVAGTPQLPGMGPPG